MFTTFLKKLFRSSIEDPSVPLTAPNIIEYVSGSGSQSAAGVTITPTVALSHPAVWRGVNLISGYIGRVPINCYKRGEDDTRVKAKYHPGHKLLNKKPHPFYLPSVFKRTLSAHAVLYGTAYAWINRDDFANPIELLILDPASTAIKDGRVKTYLGNREYIFSLEDVLIIRGLSPDGIMGYYATNLMKDSIGEGLSYIKYTGAFFKNGAKPGVIIELPPGTRDPNKIEEFRKLWGSVHEGQENSNRPAIVGAGTKVTPLQTNNEAAQLSQLREADLKSVANFLGIPPSALGADINTSYNSLEMDQKKLLNDLDVWFVAWEEEANTKLLSERQKELDTHYFECDRKALLQIDAQTEQEIIVSYLNNGILGEDQARRKLNIQKDDKDTYRRPANIQIEGEDREENREVTPPPEQQQEEQQEEGQQQEQDSRLKRMTETTLARLNKRVAKSNKPAIDHLPIFVENLSVYEGVEDICRKCLEGVQEELDAVLPEQREEVMGRITLDIMEAIKWN